MGNAAASVLKIFGAQCRRRQRGSRNLAQYIYRKNITVVTSQSLISII